MLDSCTSYTRADNTRVMAPTVPSVATGASSVTRILPYSRSQAQIQPYNSSAMYEDSMLPVYVDYIGSIMPILDRQSIATNWPPTPHPTSRQVRFMPYNSVNLPTVPYLLNVGNSRLLSEPIRGVNTMSEIALRTPIGLQRDSMSQVGVVVTRAPTTMTAPMLQNEVPATIFKTQQDQWLIHQLPKVKENI